MESKNISCMERNIYIEHYTAYVGEYRKVSKEKSKTAAWKKEKKHKILILWV